MVPSTMWEQKILFDPVHNAQFARDKCKQLQNICEWQCSTRKFKIAAAIQKTLKK